MSDVDDIQKALITLIGEADRNLR